MPMKVHMAALEIVVNQFVSKDHCKSMTRVPSLCCYDSQSEEAELDTKSDSDAASIADTESDSDAASIADTACQTTLSMAEMEMVTNLAQLVCCERLAPLRGEEGALLSPPDVFVPLEACASDRDTTPSPLPPAKTQVHYRAPTPPRGAPAKVKWNSTVKCNWPPTSPPMVGAPTPAPAQSQSQLQALRRPASVPPEEKMKTVGVMTFPAVNAGELMKKVETLEFELDVHVGNVRQLLTVNEKLRKRLEMCLSELNDAGTMNVQLDNLNDEMEKILLLLRHLSERNTILEKEKALVQAKLEREAALNKYAAAKMLEEQHIEDQIIDLSDAECQTVCYCQEVDTRKRRRERKRWLEEEISSSFQIKSRSLSPAQFRRVGDDSKLMV